MKSVQKLFLLAPLFAVAVGVAVTSCGGTTTTTDNLGGDAGNKDAGTSQVVVDSGTQTVRDSGTVVDAGRVVDSGTPVVDAGTSQLTCAELIQCANDCNDAACQQECIENTSPEGLGQLTAINDCLNAAIENQCVNACPTADGGSPANPIDGGATEDTCFDCAVPYCQTEITTCLTP